MTKTDFRDLVETVCDKWADWASPEIAVEPLISITKTGEDKFTVIMDFDYLYINDGDSFSVEDTILPHIDSIKKLEGFLKRQYLNGLVLRHTPRLIKTNSIVVRCGCGRWIERVPEFAYSYDGGYQCPNLYCKNQSIYEEKGRGYSHKSKSWGSIESMFYDTWDSLHPDSFDSVVTDPPLKTADLSWQAVRESQKASGVQVFYIGIGTGLLKGKDND